MRTTIRRILYAVALPTALWLFGGAGCRVGYSLSGAQIPAAAQTVLMPFFPNNAALVSPTLSLTLTDAMQEKFANQTNLEVLTDEQAAAEADLAFSGEITGYTATPTAVTAQSEFPAARMRLTITVRVTFTNRLAPEWNFEGRTFSQYEDYDSNRMLQDAEGELIPIIVDKLVDDIYMAAVANW